MMRGLGLDFIISGKFPLDGVLQPTHMARLQQGMVWKNQNLSQGESFKLSSVQNLGKREVRQRKQTHVSYED